MRVFHFTPGHAPELAGAEEFTEETMGFFRLDIERPEADWHEKAQPWLRMSLHDRHIRDTLNETSPPYYDGTDDYDPLVVHAFCPDCQPEAPTTCPVAFIITADAVVCIRPPDAPFFGKLRQCFLGARNELHASAASPASYGPWFLGGIMVAIVGGLLWWFHRRHWI